MTVASTRQLTVSQPLGPVHLFLLQLTVRRPPTQKSPPTNDAKIKGVWRTGACFASDFLPWRVKKMTE
jgi:hypothetical protein